MVDADEELAMIAVKQRRVIVLVPGNWTGIIAVPGTWVIVLVISVIQVDITSVVNY